MIQFKELHLLQFSNDKLAVSPLCPRCNNVVSLALMFWSSPSLVNLWSSIFKSALCNKLISPNPLTAIFGVLPLDVEVSDPQRKAVAYAKLASSYSETENLTNLPCLKCGYRK